MRRRFHAHPLPRASELLLQERVPLAAEQIEPHADEVALVEIPRTEEEIVSRRLTGIETPAPRTHLLGNGQYSAMVTSTGGGYSLCRDLAVTRWRSDTTGNSWGQFIYLRDPLSQRVWSPTYQPTRETPEAYGVIYSIDKAEFRRTDDEIETHLEVAVSPENNAEVRLLTLTNHGAKPRKIEITSYGEWVLMPGAGDAAHPAFHKLFVETEYIAEETALLARCRPRDASHAPVFGIYVLACHGDVSETIQYETSREAFLGRGRTPRRPAALDAADYWVEHGPGYTRFTHRASDVDHELHLSIAPDDPVKLIRLKLTNWGTTTRDLSLTYFAEWVLGVSRDQTQRFIYTEIDSATGALLARNTHHPDLPTQVEFLHVLGPHRSCTGDRTEFIGRNGSLHQPQALQFSGLSGRTGTGLDPCGAVQSKIRLAIVARERST